MDNKKQLIALALCGLVGVAQAGEKEELLKLRNTTTNLIKELVKQGILSEKVADEMIKKAESDAENQAQQQAAKQGMDAPEPGEVRVPYVPDFVKEEIRKQVRGDLREEVVGEVMQKAKNEKWGTPDALPDWVNRFKLSGDLRLRSQSDYMSNDNSQGYYFNSQQINQSGGFDKTPLPNRYLNTNHDRHRFRERLRLAIDAKVTDDVQAGVRLATSNMIDPVSTNQTLGNYSGQYQFNVDRAFLKYDATNDQGFKWLTVTGGRMANPWYVGGSEFTAGSELVWDTDLSFEGLAATGRHSFASVGPQEKDDGSRSVYATIGGFPLQESALSSHDKWLFGGQLGVDWGFDNHDAIKAGVAYYDYRNLKAKPSDPTLDCDSGRSAASDLSIPQFLQFGNSLASICSNFSGTISSSGRRQFFGLASDYRIFNANFSYDFSKFAPYHVIFGGDYAKNVGYTGHRGLDLLNNNDGARDQTNAWQARVDFGWPKVDRAGQWNVFTLYKYVERDAVLDAYTDSDFHLGGTNAKGWVVGGNYGLMKNVWFTGRWLSTDVITGPRYGNDVLQLDLNTKF